MAFFIKNCMNFFAKKRKFAKKFSKKEKEKIAFD
jgi:hypothetical protein